MCWRFGIFVEKMSNFFPPLTVSTLPKEVPTQARNVHSLGGGQSIPYTHTHTHNRHLSNGCDKKLVGVWRDELDQTM